MKNLPKDFRFIFLKKLHKSKAFLNIFLKKKLRTSREIRNSKFSFFEVKVNLKLTTASLIYGHSTHRFQCFSLLAVLISAFISRSTCIRSSASQSVKVDIGKSAKVIVHCRGFCPKNGTFRQRRSLFYFCYGKKLEGICRLVSTDSILARQYRYTDSLLHRRTLLMISSFHQEDLQDQQDLLVIQMIEITNNRYS